MAIDDGTQLLLDCMAASYRPWHLLGPPDGGRRLGEPVVKNAKQQKIECAIDETRPAGSRL